MRRPSGISPELQAELDKIEWIDLGGGRRIMKGEVTVKLFKLVMEGYEITGPKADRLKAILADPAQEGNALTCVSLLDGRDFSKRLASLKGTKVGVQTEADWEAARDQLSGANWTWTETPHIGGTFVLRHLDYDRRHYGDPGIRFDLCALRLVEDISV